MLDRLALGTAQFGMRYGVSNTSGPMPDNDARTILRHARDLGMDTLDTAIAYGNAEARIGEIGAKGWRIITKLPALPDNVVDVSSWVEDSVRGALARLGCPTMGGVLLHRSADLTGPHGAALRRALNREQAEGRVRSIGVSIYSPDELDSVWASFRPDIVQAPLSVLDRRLETSGWLARLVSAGVQIHTRSAFLQGLLLMSPTERPRKFERWANVWSAWSDWLASEKLRPQDAALAHALSYSEVERVVVGVDNVGQLADGQVAFVARGELFRIDTTSGKIASGSTYAEDRPMPARNENNSMRSVSPG